ncbi:MAG: DUF2007 domain-containing protein [Hyphomonadaceae bacterium]|jgi:hypothetical protein|nr:DUF2007 domain-containing protein [Hyphomonadaceae bacterium]
MSSLVIVARFSSRSEAVVAQSVLQSAGVETLLPEFNVLMAELDPSMMEHGWRLMASEDDVETARSILAEAQQQGG